MVTTKLPSLRLSILRKCKAFSSTSVCLIKRTKTTDMPKPLKNKMPAGIARNMGSNARRPFNIVAKGIKQNESYLQSRNQQRKRQKSGHKLSAKNDFSTEHKKQFNNLPQIRNPFSSSSSWPTISSNFQKTRQNLSPSPTIMPISEHIPVM